MLDSFRSKRRERRLARDREAFARAAAGSEPVTDDRRARDLPDPLGELNELTRMGPTIGGTGSTGP